MNFQSNLHSLLGSTGRNYAIVHLFKMLLQNLDNQIERFKTKTSNLDVVLRTETKYL